MAFRQVTEKHEPASALSSQSTVSKESARDAEQRSNIPVICHSSRSEEGNSRKPKEIYVNPKFFKSSLNERAPGAPQIFGQGPPAHQPRFDHGQGIGMGFNDGYPPPRHFDGFPQRFPPPRPPYPPFRPNFPPFQGHMPNFPPRNRFNWQGGADLSTFPPAYHTGPPLRPPFQRDVPSNYVEWNQPMQPPEFHPGFHNLLPLHHGRAKLEPVPGPSYYEAFQDDKNRLNDHKLGESSHTQRRRDSRSRSRSRSLSRSSSGYSIESNLGRRSHSLSSGPQPKKHRHRSSESNTSDEETVWISDNERNSDSDQDLSKPLDSLTSNVANSKSLLRDALKCLGPAKIQTMIPLELCQLDRRELFQMCKELLDETEHDELIKVMEGSIGSKGKDESQNSEHSQTYQSNNSDSEKDVATARRKVSKKKKSKKKRKKKKKNRSSQDKTESDAESQVTLEEDDDSSTSFDKSSTSASENVPNPVSSSVTTQQSLLELIQIEYKTKAINVMLKNLGVATEISALVSNALHTNGISVAQDPEANQEVIETDEESQSSAGKIGVPSEVQPATVSTGEKNIAPVIFESDSDAVTKPGNINVISENTSEDSEKEDDTVTHAKTNSVDTKSSILNDGTESVLLDEKELLSGVVEDVLDLGVGANEGLDFL